MNFFNKYMDPILFMVISLVVSFFVCYSITHWFGFFVNFRSETDMFAYIKQAEGILNGTWPEQKPFYRAPLYPYFLALLKFIGRSEFIITFLQSYFLATAISLTAISAQILFNRKAGWIAFGLFIFYGPVFIFACHFHSTALEVFLAALVLFLLILLNKKDTLALTVGLGLAGALLVLVRPNYLPIIPLVYFLQAWQLKLKKSHIVAFLLIFTLPLISIIIRNNIYSDDFVLLTTNGAETWRLSNSHVSTVFNFVNHKEEAMSVFSLDFIKLFLNKCIGYWWNAEVGQNISPVIVTEGSSILKLFFVNHALLGALFLVSCGFLFKENKLRPFLLMFWLYYFTICAFFIISRFRMPNLPVMIVLISGALYQLHLIPKKKLLWMAFAFITLFILMRPYDNQLDPRKERKNYVVSALNKGHLEEAEHQLEMYLNKKDDLEMHMYLWSVRVLRGEKPMTIKAYESALFKLYKNEIVYQTTATNIVNFKRSFLGQQGDIIPIKKENLKHDYLSRVINCLPMKLKSNVTSKKNN